MHSSESGFRPPVEEKSPFDYDGVAHNLVDHYRPQFVARGGEHIVYAIPEYPDIVIKVATEPLKYILEGNVERGNAPDAMPEELRAELEVGLSEEVKRHQQLRDYFGEEHVPLQRRFLLKIPVTESIWNEIYQGAPPAVPKEAWSAVLMQERTQDLDGEQLSPVSGYSEVENVPDDVYAQETRRLVYNEKQNEPFSLDQLLAVQPNQRLADLVKQAAVDPALKASLSDFVERTVRYAQETGEALDLAGDDNVYFVHKDGQWNYRLIDALYPGANNIVSKAREIIAKCSNGGSLEGITEPNVLMNAINFVRTINGLAEYLGVAERIELIPPEAQASDLNFKHMIQQAETV